MLHLTSSRFVMLNQDFTRSKMIKNEPIRYQLKIYKNSGEILSLNTANKRRIFYQIQTANESEVLKYFLRITYSPILDNFGKKINPTNEGYYKTKKELMHAWQCFTEK